ncbi:MAG TPA: hypothetical protein VLA78_12930, partial [Paracoccaceae bacterium]|nr:hypothetical protein [Paracoccaceae bacterium]
MPVMTSQPLGNPAGSARPQAAAGPVASATPGAAEGATPGDALPLVQDGSPDAAHLPLAEPMPEDKALPEPARSALPALQGVLLSAQVIAWISTVMIRDARPVAWSTDPMAATVVELSEAGLATPGEPVLLAGPAPSTPLSPGGGAPPPPGPPTPAPASTP